MINLLSIIWQDALIIGVVALLLIVAILILVLIFRKGGASGAGTSISDIEKTNTALFEKIRLMFDSQYQIARQNNELITQALNTSNENLLNFLKNSNTAQAQQMQNVETRVRELLSETEQRLVKIQEVIASNLNKIQEDNAKSLNEMRQTVDEKLNISLERRLNESFALISERLDKVHRGLGEMQELATGVGDLKKVLTNVKTRGVWGEVQLGNILEQMLAPSQFIKEAQIKSSSSERVDYAIMLPGKDDEFVLLPIDAKFPLEDYQRLVEASEVGNVSEVEKSRKELVRRVKEEAKKIQEKYIDIPKTTDFAVMYLALEGLYAEVVKDAGLIENLQQQYRIVVCGPTTLSALVNSLQMGFKTVAIEKRSSEVWALLSTFKTEFVKFVDLLSKTQRKLDEASSTIEDATKKTKSIQKKLNAVGIEGVSIKPELEDSSEEN